MKLNPEAEAEIARLISSDAYQHFPAETVRAAMRWAYVDALRILRTGESVEATKDQT